ncbi:MAG: HlyD family efflux transporter periplasmic adaptor subunit, partial [Rhodospirillaceae bacterium]|nr:HlyD family efflux transporter periplasmic adaptor subunit [Rhodospirillaceae bacterium]MDD9929379.1 HlyD family efflux transporter periplasmic adaptor subunit [Rhodospirillaceae bacterium]
IYTVSAPLPGRAMRITHEVGDAVVGGETVLATIEPGDPSFLDLRARTKADAEVKAAVAALALARAEENRARAELDFAQAELARAEQLAARRTISESALDRAVLEAKTRQATLDTARAATKVRAYELEVARASLIEAGEGQPDTAAPTGCCVPVRAPVDGRILRILHKSAGIVGAGDPLIEIGNPEELEIVVDLLSSDAVRIEPDDDVIIEAWGGQTKLSGKVQRIEPTGFTKVSALGIEEQRVNAVIDLVGGREGWKRLGHGYRVQLGIVTWAKEDAVRIPIGSLFRTGDAWSVFVVAEGIVSLRNIRIGNRNAHHAEVLEGIAEGDVVVHHPSDRITDGVSVISRELR